MGRADSRSCWRPASAARPLHWVGSKQLASLAACLQQVLTTWEGHWGLPSPLGEVACRPATAAAAAAPGRWQGLTVAGAAAGWLRLPPDDAHLRAAWGDTRGAASLVGALARCCREDAVAALAAALRWQPGAAGDAPAAELLRPHSGAVEAVLPPPLDALLVVSASAFQAWLGRPAPAHRMRPGATPLCAAAAALGGRELALHVRLAGCEIPLARLQQLQVGDVLRLPHALQAPAQVSDSDGTALFDGWLGRQRQARAIALLRPLAEREGRSP